MAQHGGYLVTLDTGELESAREAAILDDIGREARALGMLVSHGTHGRIEWHMPDAEHADRLRTYAKSKLLPKWWRLS